MIKTKKINFFAILASLFLHSIFALILGFSFHQLKKNVGLNKPNIINSYVISNSLAIKPTTTEKFKDASEKPPLKNPAKIISKVLEKSQHHSQRLQKKHELKQMSAPSQKATLHQNNQQLSISGQQKDQLLMLLHQAIQAHQSYPPMALEMQRQGRVTIGFTLLRNGNIANLRIVNSSGTSSLDAAGMQAVRTAAPFQQVGKYLSLNSQYFIIDVVFELPTDLG